MEKAGKEGAQEIPPLILSICGLSLAIFDDE